MNIFRHYTAMIYDDSAVVDVDILNESFLYIFVTIGYGGDAHNMMLEFHCV